MITSVYFSLIFVGYLACFILYFADFEMGSPALLATARRLCLVTLALHLAALVAPFFGCKIMTASVRPEFAIPFFILAVSLAVEMRARAGFLMLFSLPTALIFLFASLRNPGDTEKLLTHGGFWLWLHLGLVFLGMAVLGVAVSTAAMYLFQSQQLKSHRPGKFFLELPSLGTLDRIHSWALMSGVVLFTLGLVSGAFWAEEKRELMLFGKDPTVILSVAACALYWAITAMRLSSIGRGRKIALGTLGVFMLLFLAAIHAHAS